MSIGIAVCLQDGALMVADGRQTAPMVSGWPVITDAANKIAKLTESVSCISFGLTQVTDSALQIVRPLLLTPTSPAQIMHEVERSVQFAWKAFYMLAPDVDRTHPAMRAGLLVGGYLPEERGGFIGGVLFRPDGHDVPMLRTRQFEFLVLGGEENGSQEIFKQVAGQNLASATEPREGIYGSWVKSLLDAAVTAIRKIEQNNSTIGGVIRYAILRSGFPYFEHISDK
jgi:hypothetical protein